jgi:YHS domain-containing protein
MIDQVAKRASRIHPQTLAAAEQVAQSVPHSASPIGSNFLPSGQSPVIPEPIQMIGRVTQDADAPIRTVGGQAIAPTAPDERVLQSVPVVREFVDELKPPTSPTVQGKAPHVPNLPIGMGSTPVKTTIDVFATAPISQASPTSSLPLGFGGSCPLTWLATGKLVPGNRSWGCEHRGRLYLFASRELRDQFRVSPDRHSPMLAGYDPVVYADTGELIDGSLDYLTEVESDQQRCVVLFASAETKATFLSNPPKYLDEIRQAVRVADGATLLR